MKALTEQEIVEIKKLMEEQPPLEDEIPEDPIAYLSGLILVLNEDVLNLSRRVRLLENEVYEYAPD